MINLNLEQLGVVDKPAKPIYIGLAYNKTLTAGQEDSWTYSAPASNDILITDFSGTHTGGDLSVTIKDSGSDQYLTSLATNTTSVPFKSVFRDYTIASGTELQYPLLIRANNTVTFYLKNTHASTSATGVFAALSGIKLGQ